MAESGASGDDLAQFIGAGFSPRPEAGAQYRPKLIME